MTNKYAIITRYSEGPTGTLREPVWYVSSHGLNIARYAASRYTEEEAVRAYGRARGGFDSTKPILRAKIDDTRTAWIVVPE